MRAPTHLALLLPLLLAVGCGSGDSAGSPDGGSAADASLVPDGGDASSGGGPDARMADGRPGSPDGGTGSPDGGSGSPDGSAGGSLASRYPCDQGLQNDPAFVWGENFEEGAVATFTARYDQVDNVPGMAMVSDIPAKSCGAHSLSLTSGGAVNATDFYKKLPNQDELFVRWYVKYQAGAPWHHTGVWFGGYNPPQTYPSPHAGTKPAGSDLFSIAIEPVWGTGSPNPDFDFYNYWMGMHTCSSCGGAYWGNALVSRNAFTADDNQWVCVETHAKVNTDVGSSTGAVLEVWKNDALVQSFPETGSVGFWVQDHYCPVGADGAQCNYSPTAPGPLDLQLRSTAALQLNYFWPQNYITSAETGTIQLDDMVVATSRVGCLQ